MSSCIRAGLVLVVVFAAGVVTGLLVGREDPGVPAATEIRGQGREVIRHLEHGAEGQHEATLASLRESVGLDDEQVEQIEALLVARQGEVDQMWAQLRPEVHRAMQQVHREIAELLRPEQRQRYHEWLLERREQHRRFGEPSPDRIPAEH